MRLAIVHDDLMRRGGAEQVARCFHYAFPEAPIYTLCYQPEDTYPDFKSSDVRTSWFQRVVKDEHQMKKLFFPLGVWAMQHLDVSQYDVVLLSSTYCAKYVKVSPHTLVINYCHQPFRLAWYPESYAEYLNARGFKKIILKAIITRLQKIDYQAAQRTDFFISNTEETANKIKDIYNYKLPIKVIYPPVVTNNFQVAEKPEDYYLMVTRLEYYKRVDLAIEVFNRLGFKLIIVGKGTKETELKKLAQDNIVFKSGLSKTELKHLYAGCKALIFPQYEDFGITPLEANASGRPVVAFGQGGVLNTIIPYQGNPKKSTGIFFSDQEPACLQEAINLMEKIYSDFDSEFIRHHALKFDEKNFISEISNYVKSKFTLRSQENRPYRD